MGQPSINKLVFCSVMFSFYESVKKCQYSILAAEPYVQFLECQGSLACSLKAIEEFLKNKSVQSNSRDKLKSRDIKGW